MTVSYPGEVRAGSPNLAVLEELTADWAASVEFVEEDDTVRLRTESFDEERIVYMDGRDFPPADERSRFRRRTFRSV